MIALQAIPAMLLALVLCFDYRKSRDIVTLLELHSSKANKYIWYALPGYAIGLIAALAAGVLTHSPQPALLYLVRFLMLSPEKNCSEYVWTMSLFVLLFLCILFL